MLPIRTSRLACTQAWLLILCLKLSLFVKTGAECGRPLLYFSSPFVPTRHMLKLYPASSLLLSRPDPPSACLQFPGTRFRRMRTFRRSLKSCRGARSRTGNEEKNHVLTRFLLRVACLTGSRGPKNASEFSLFVPPSLQSRLSAKARAVCLAQRRRES